jgi:hypothetical protein
MSVVSSTDVECFRRLTNPEVVDVNGSGTSTRQIAQQLRQAMEQAVAKHSEEMSKPPDDSSDDEDRAPARATPSAPSSAQPSSSSLARAMQAIKGAPASPESRPQEPPLQAQRPSSLPVVAPAPPPVRAASPKPEDDDKESSSDEEASTVGVKLAPEAERLEKQGYLIELQALQAKGVKLSRDFSMKDSLTELEFEVQKQNSVLNAAAAVSNMKDMMRIAFNGVEMANSRLGPFLCIDGWADSLTSDMKRFDSALEKLYKRYWRKQSMSPIMELGMIILGSLAMHHFKTKLFGPVGPRPRPAQAPPVEAAPPPPATPRLRRGTPPQAPSGSFRDARPGGRPTLRPPTSVFGM